MTLLIFNIKKLIGLLEIHLSFSAGTKEYELHCHPFFVALKPAEVKKILITSLFSSWLKADRSETRANRWGRKEVEVLKFVLHCTLRFLAT